MNYQTELEKLLLSIEKEKKSVADEKPSLLLHACCAPCSSYVLEYLASFFKITILYYNPNIFPEEEYKRRLEELKKFLPEFFPAKENSVKLVEDCYVPQEFYDAIRINENPELAAEQEKGERCRRCYKLRLSRAFKFAQENGFDYFCTTLSISPFKDSEKINQIGKDLSECGNGKTKWLFSDFKKKGGFLRSLELSKEFSLYRQQYCGCVFSSENSSRKHGQQEKTEAQP